MAIEIFTVFIIMFILSIVAFKSLHSIDGKQLSVSQRGHYVIAWRSVLAIVVAGVVYFGSFVIKI